PAISPAAQNWISSIGRQNAEDETAGNGRLAAGSEALDGEGRVARRQEAGGEGQAERVALVEPEVGTAPDVLPSGVPQDHAVGRLMRRIDLQGEDDPAGRARQAQAMGRLARRTAPLGVEK